MDKATFHNEIMVGVYGELWPRSPLTPVETRLWFQSLCGFTQETIELAFNRHYQSSKYAPKLAEILGRCRESSGSVQRAGAESHEADPWSAQKSIWADGLDPVERDRVFSMTDRECRLRHAHWCWSRACGLYGRGSRSAARAYWQWQSALDEIGMDSVKRQENVDEHAQYLAEMSQFVRTVEKA